MVAPLRGTEIHNEAHGGPEDLGRGKGRKRGRKEGRKEGGRRIRRARINYKIVCDGCIRKDANICHTRFINTVYIQETHLDLCLRYKARNHFMPPWVI